MEVSFVICLENRANVYVICVASHKILGPNEVSGRNLDSDTF